MSIGCRQAHLNSTSTRSNLFNLFHFEGLTVEFFQPREGCSICGCDFNQLSFLDFCEPVYSTFRLPGVRGDRVFRFRAVAVSVTVTFSLEGISTDPEGCLKQMSGALPKELAATQIVWLLKPRESKSKQVYFLFLQHRLVFIIHRWRLASCGGVDTYMEHVGIQRNTDHHLCLQTCVLFHFLVDAVSLPVSALCISWHLYKYTNQYKLALEYVCDGC